MPGGKSKQSLGRSLDMSLAKELIEKGEREAAIVK